MDLVRPEPRRAIGHRKDRHVRLDRETSLPVAWQLKGRGIPFVFVTGQLNTDQIHAEWRDVRIISKPFDRRTILAAVADMLETDKQPR